jgi:hypothetical protein
VTHGKEFDDGKYVGRMKWYVFLKKKFYLKVIENRITVRGYELRLLVYHMI